MSRRVLAPVLLLLAAACSIAAVFAVHRIESSGGPLSQPSATTYFSPNGDDVQDVANVRFTTREPEHVLVYVLDTQDGSRVTTLLDEERVNGATTLTWDGTTDEGKRVADGEYRFQIQRQNDSRTYAPTTDVVVDTSPPIGILDRATLELGELRGLAMLGPNEKLEVFERGSDKPVEGLRQFTPRDPDATSAQPFGDAPDDTRPIRFTVAIAGTPERIDVIDLAGNRRPVFPDPDVEYKANG